MKSIEPALVVGLFDRFANRFEAERDALIALDGKVGDSDLGLTMSKAFIAARDKVHELDQPGLGDLMKQAGAAISKAAPSTMGTLMATGFLRGGKALGEAETLDVSGLAAFWRAYADGVAMRGKAQLGDKTVLDVLDPIAQAFEAQAETGAELDVAGQEAAKAAADALEATKKMVAQHGKAAAFQEKTLGLQDAGGTVACMLAEELSLFLNEKAAG
ncbi:dihydroxyacetone kinase, C-terminal domain [Cohaesibacter sp. ES.047]|uniref:dihydroxyacetone kinase subunit L n=1 Tax=Cohaesibacter sp. ES.047 TaxID=1798205 RepID=UPI000BB8B4F7|nr:dihydroxyacetone kinase subunit L [Cohaesibacter sp. ES.047]SNY92253.1 dihydroxyacetone kinase, C-terminal domain [Cohaesibacter sp. ES.047]